MTLPTYCTRPGDAVAERSRWENRYHRRIELALAGHLESIGYRPEQVLTASGQRDSWPIPKGAKKEAERGLAWRKEFKRGSGPVGMNTARQLVSRDSLGIEKIRHIAKYFPRHEPDKRAEGYRPGEKGYPSNGRIAWALWGGDTAWSWSQRIVEADRKRRKREKAGETFDALTAAVFPDWRNASRAVLDRLEGLPGDLVNLVTAWTVNTDDPQTAADRLAPTLATQSFARHVLDLIAEEPGPRLTKQWLSRRDDRVRDTHAAADGQKVPLYSPFVVGGQKLQYPGDPTAAIGEWINCRCMLIGLPNG